MRDYTSMSDAEINASVAKIMFEVNEGIATPYSHRPDAYIYHLNGLHSVKDYCNNPADAWPIITANRIGVIPGPEHVAWRAAHRVIGEDSNPRHFTQDANPLRAAMIVFLKMKEVEND